MYYYCYSVQSSDFKTFPTEVAQKMFRDEEILHDAIRKNLHPEKSFVESTKIWLAQQNFSFKYGSMEILFELIKKILLIVFAIPFFGSRCEILLLDLQK